MSRHGQLWHLAPLVLALVLCAFVSGAAGAAVAPRDAAPADISQQAPATNPPEANPLPIGMTPEEEKLKDQIGTYTLDTAPPPGPGIRQCAEWEPVTGALVRYPFGLPYDILAEMAKNIELWVLVADQSEQNACSAALQSNGVNMANVRFVQCATNSIWTRDYGPQFEFDANGDQGIIDHHYNRPRPDDDKVNYYLGPAWDLPVYGTPLVHTGGNYMCDGHDNAISTDLVWDENPSLTHDQIAAIMQSYLGINTYHVVPDIEPSGIHHIDCWAKFLDERTLLVKQVDPTNPYYNAIEQDVALFRTFTDAYGQPYKIVRVLCGPTQGDVASYTNSILLNNKCFVPQFGISTDAAALQTYQNALPGYEVIGYTGSWLPDDAIHCRIMGIHDKYMLRVDVAPLPDTVMTTGSIRLDALVDDRSGAGLKPDSLLVYWRTFGQLNFTPLTMAPTGAPDSFYVNIPPQPAGTLVQYYVFAADQSNRRETRPPSAPAGFYSVRVLDTAGVPAGSVPAPFALSLSGANPFRDGAELRFRIPVAGPVKLTVADISGREIATVLARDLPAGEHSVRWDGRLDGGAAAPNGIYFFRLTTAGGLTECRRGVLIR